MLRQKQGWLHWIMCFIGGAAGVYTMLRCAGVLGNAQTTNLINILRALFSGDITGMLLKAAGLLFYMAGAVCCVIVEEKTGVSMQKWVIGVQLVCILTMGLLPASVGIYPCLYAAFFMASTQYSVFHGALGYDASTIFSSNNVKQLSLSLSRSWLRHDKAQGRRAKFFALTLLAFHIGVMAEYFLYMLLGTYSILLLGVPVCMCAMLREHFDKDEDMVVVHMLQFQLMLVQAQNNKRRLKS